MRRLLAIMALVTGCQSAQQSDTTAGVGTTTYTRGPTDTVSTDTTRTGGETVQPSGEVTLTLDKSSYARGSTAVMTIRSRSEDTLGYNPCSNRSVERQEGRSWVKHPEPDRMCTMELRLLMPGQTQTANTDVPASLTAGTYRITLLLSRQRNQRPGEQASGTVQAISPAFRVN